MLLHWIRHIACSLTEKRRRDGVDHNRNLNNYDMIFHHRHVLISKNTPPFTVTHHHHHYQTDSYSQANGERPTNRANPPENAQIGKIFFLHNGSSCMCQQNAFRRPEVSHVSFTRISSVGTLHTVGKPSQCSRTNDNSIRHRPPVLNMSREDTVQYMLVVLDKLPTTFHAAIIQNDYVCRCSVTDCVGRCQCPSAPLLPRQFQVHTGNGNFEMRFIYSNAQ
ncbi:hypothetical protein B0T14DRAFT_520069 [Immersiella caudata]|uniref:Uncharacterized protein n=1 Tax=Immersiella caudata TaxID=314043 RepID=A0AA40C089_9PEZI|nr:hypothetical protein B0T14DRAFT_520069 [Immersiella caudata]